MTVHLYAQGFAGAVGLDDFGVHVTVISPTAADPTGGRNQVLTSAEVDAVVRQLPAVEVVVVGMVYAMQVRAIVCSAALREKNERGRERERGSEGVDVCDSV